jgi:SprT protein
MTTPLLLGTKHGPEIERWIREACAANDYPELAGEIRWQFNARFGAKMGDAFYAKKLVRFSAPLWPRATPEQREQTVKHEACHLIAFDLEGYPAKGHGEHWAKCMRAAGLDPKRCHSVDTTGVKGKMKRYPLKCDCRTHMVSVIKYNRIKRAFASYKCRLCQGKLRAM